MKIAFDQYVLFCINYFFFCTNTSFTLVVALEAAKSTSPLGTAVPKVVERHFHPAFCGTVLGPWTFRGTWR